MKLLSDLLPSLKAAGMEFSLEEGSRLASEVKVESLVFDSRQVTAGALFFALPGTHTDGGKYIDEAIKRGAVAVVYQGEPFPVTGDCHGALRAHRNDESGVFIRVKDTRRAMAPIADCFFDHPSSHLVVIGVTGTEGKSSTVSFIWQLLRLAGKKAGFVSTVEYSTGGEAIPNPEHQTTPEAPIVQKRLYEMVCSGCEYAVLESSSHALSKRTARLECVLFDCAVFMNVTLEHLEFHGTFEQYRDDKANLFRALDTHEHKKTIGGKEVDVPCAGIVNSMDKSAPYFAKATKHKVLFFGMEGESGSCNDKGEDGLVAREVQSDDKGISFFAGGIHVTAPLPGAFNALNIMAAVLAVNSVVGECPAAGGVYRTVTGAEIKGLFALCTNLKPIKGRMEHINRGQPFEVIVDYAHTPSSFEVVLPPIRKRCTGKVIALFGSGGERDRVKRPLQGEAAAKYCDIIVLANEDPRLEDEMQILREIAEGAKKGGKREGEDLFLIPDRVEAIRFAFNHAQAGDIVLLLGKGHENSIIGKDGPVPYDEAKAAAQVLDNIVSYR